jgi:hypothetical protein
MSAGGRCLAAPQDPNAAPASTGASSPLVEDITRLWRANLSEEFIAKYFAHSVLARDLTPQDIVLLRNAGVPETLITSITLGRTAPGAAAGALPSVPAPPESRRWDGLALRNSGIVLLKSRWDAGTLEIKEGSLRWIDSRQTDKNLLVPMAQVTEQQLTCLKKAGGNECFEWVVKTRNEEYRFRDVAWRQGENAKVLDLFDTFHVAYPALISSRNPVDEK